jgi:hypothetical protein
MRTNKKFTFFLKKTTYVLSILFHQYIKFKVQTHSSLAITKKQIYDIFMSLDYFFFFTTHCLLRDLNLKFYTWME